MKEKKIICQLFFFEKSIQNIMQFEDHNMYSKTCVKWPLQNRQNTDLNDKW